VVAIEGVEHIQNVDKQIILSVAYKVDRVFLTVCVVRIILYDMIAFQKCYKHLYFSCYEMCNASCLL
jgi:hypothetical protein